MQETHAIFRCCAKFCHRLPSSVRICAGKMPDEDGELLCNAGAMPH